MSVFQTPSQIAKTYFQILKSIKPSINTADANSDFVIRGNTFSGIVSGLYGDQAKVDNDSFITSMRDEALTLKGADFGITQSPATAAVGTDVQISGVNGTVISIGELTFLYPATNILYTNTSGGTIASGILNLEVQATITGQIGNIVAPDTLQVVSPPTGVNTTATLIANISDGADIETFDSYRARLLSYEQNPPAGGNQTDYPNFAFAASSSVRSAIIRRFGRGLGTVDVYITTGTTDIDTAVTNGTAIVRIPSSLAIATVQAYYNSHVPLTDCPAVYPPVELDVNVTVNVILATGFTLTSIPSDAVNNPLNLNVQQLIQREVDRVLYKLPVGGRVIPGYTNGFVTASDIEENLDVWLSAVLDPVSGNAIGKIPILADRQCQKLNSPNYNLPILSNQLAAPGTVTVIVGGI